MRRIVSLLGMIPVVTLLALLASPPALAKAIKGPKGPSLDGAPTIRVNHGSSEMALQDFDDDAARLGFGELALGFTQDSKVKGGIIKSEVSDLAFTFLSVDLGGEAEADEIEPEFWRIGANSASGYGYVFKRSAFIPYNSTGICITRMAGDIDFDALEDGGRLETFHEKVRFGSKMEAGARVRVGPLFELQAGYDRSLAFRRLLFWKWAGSAMLEMISQSALDEFIDKVRDRSPKAAPIVHFVLKNGLSFAWYELRRDDMNWPFDSAPPLMLDTFKVGVGFEFS